MDIFDPNGYAFEEMRAPPGKETYFTAEDQDIASARVRELFFAGVRLLVDETASEILCQFVAARTEHACDEQYYAVTEWAGERSVRSVVEAMQTQLIDDDRLYLPLGPDRPRETEGLLSHPLDDIEEPAIEQAAFDRQAFERELQAMIPTSERCLRLGTPTAKDAYATALTWLTRQTGQLLVADAYVPGSGLSVDVDVVVVPEHGQWEWLEPLA